MSDGFVPENDSASDASDNNTNVPASEPGSQENQPNIDSNTEVQESQNTNKSESNSIENSPTVDQATQQHQTEENIPLSNKEEDSSSNNALLRSATASREWFELRGETNTISFSSTSKFELPLPKRNQREPILEYIEQESYKKTEVVNKSERAESFDKSNAIKLISFSNKRRFEALSEEERQLEWIHPFIENQTCDIITSEPIPPIEIVPKQYECEENIETIQEKTENSLTPQQYSERFKSIQDLADHSSTHIVDKNVLESNQKLLYKYLPPHVNLKFLKIKSIDFNRAQSGLFNAAGDESQKTFFSVFTYNFQEVIKKDSSYFLGKPSSETLKIEIGDNNTVFKSYGYQFDDGVLMPFVADKELSYLVFLVHTLDSAGILTTLAVGCSLIPQEGDFPEFKLTWFPYDAKKSLYENLTTKHSYSLPMHLVLSIEIVEEFEEGKTLRYSNQNPLYPSPIFTVCNVKLNLQQKFADSQTRVFVQCHLKRVWEDPKCELPPEIESYMIVDGAESVLAINGKSSTFPGAETIHFPDVFNFYISQEIKENLQLTIDVIRIDSKNVEKLLFSHTANLNTFMSSINEKMDSKTFSFSRGNTIIQCFTIFPSVVKPPESIKQALQRPNSEPNFTNNMMESLITNLIDVNLQISNLDQLQFNFLNRLLDSAGQELSRRWIESYFAPATGWSIKFAEKMSNDIRAIADRDDISNLYFLLLFKAMCCENLIDIPTLLNLYDQIATIEMHHPSKQNSADKINSNLIHQNAAHFLILLTSFFPYNFVHLIAYNFLSQLNVNTLLFYYTYFFADFHFIQTIAYRDLKLKNVPVSPYMPLISLFNHVVTDILTENDPQQIKLIANVIGILATSIEYSADDETAEVICRNLFPLLPIIFTFYDVINDMTDVIVKLNILLILFMKNIDENQIFQYYSMLSNDNQLRFFDFIKSVIDHDVICNIAANSVNLVDNSLCCKYEITWRFIHFIKFINLITEADTDHLASIFSIFEKVLLLQEQASDSFEIIYQSLGRFVVRFTKEIFKDKTVLINVLMTTVVQLTQRKLYTARTQSIGFILWLIDQEKSVRTSYTRSNLALQFAVCNALFVSSSIIPFFEFLPDGFTEVKDLYNKLLAGLDKSVLYENRIGQLLNLYNDFKNFPSIRARIYEYITSLNKEHQNYAAAFIAKWKLCALIAEVFKMKGQKVTGIPPTGSDAFKYVINEPGVDLSKYPADSSFLVMESEIFTEASFSEALQEAMALCQKAEFHWLIGDVTEILFDFLEKHREFGLLKKLSTDTINSYNALSKTEKPSYMFLYLYVKGKHTERIKWQKTIQMHKRIGDYYDDLSYMDAFMKKNECLKVLVPEISAALKVKSIVTEIEPKDSQMENYGQLIIVNFDQDTLAKFHKCNADQFHVDIPLEEKGWDDPYVKRYIFITESPFPSPVSIVPIKEEKVINITKRQFYIDELTYFKNHTVEKIENIKNVLPPEKMAKMWSQYVLGINGTPLLKVCKRVLINRTKPYLQLTFEYHQMKMGRETSVDFSTVPKEIKKLMREIRELLLQSIAQIDVARKVSPLEESELDDLNKIKISFGIPLVDESK